MKPKLKLAKVAESLGWTDCYMNNDNGPVFGKPPVGCQYAPIDLHGFAEVKYDSSLDWMHEAEKGLSMKQLVTYEIRLNKMNLRNTNYGYVECVVNATAPQRFNAYGITRGLWKEGE